MTGSEDTRSYTRRTLDIATEVAGVAWDRLLELDGNLDAAMIAVGYMVAKIEMSAKEHAKARRDWTDAPTREEIFMYVERIIERGAISVLPKHPATRQ